MDRVGEPRKEVDSQKEKDSKELRKEKQRQLEKRHDYQRLHCLYDKCLQQSGERFKALDELPGPSSGDRLNWEEVVEAGELVARQAAAVGALWIERIPEAIEIEESMTSYFKELQGFLVAVHLTTIDIGPTLFYPMRDSTILVASNSLSLMKESIESFGRSSGQTKKLSDLVDTVLEACSALKKIPATNTTAIGRALSQTAVTMKEVLQEMKELKPACFDLATEPDENSTRYDAVIHNRDDEGSGAGIGNDLSPEEMVVAQASIDVVSEVLLIVKELIRSITGLLEIESSNCRREFIMSLENLLKLCQEISLQVEKLGACLYPPQEVHAILTISGVISSLLHDLENGLKDIGGTSNGFVECCDNVRSKLKHLEHEIGCSQVEQQLQSISLSGSQSGAKVVAE